MKNFTRGFSLPEIIAVCAVLGILIAIVLPRFYTFREDEVIQGAGKDILSAIDRARTQTLASLNQSEYGVHFDSNQLVIFKGMTYSSGASTNEVISISTPASISNVTLGGTSGTSGDFYFNRLNGAPSKTGTVTLSSSNFTKTLTISATGVASIN